MPLPEEYYVRSPDSETANGPYNTEKLITLAEAGRIQPDTLYYDTQQESWLPIASNEDLKQQVFPVKKKLGLRARAAEEYHSLNEDVGGPKISVEHMLAEAEGETDETKHMRRSRDWQEKAASLSMPLLGAVLLVSAVGFIVPSWDSVQALLDNEPGAFSSLFIQPLLLLGVLDLLLALGMFLHQADLFPVIRFRGMFGLGYFGLIYGFALLAGDPSAQILLICSVGLGLGLFVSTLTLDLRVMLASLAAAVLGGCGFVYYNNLLPLIL